MEVTAFHPFRRKLVTFATRRSNRLVSVALFLTLYLAAFSVRPLAVIPLCAARTFLPLFTQAATVWLASMPFYHADRNSL